MKIIRAVLYCMSVQGGEVGVWNRSQEFRETEDKENEEIDCLVATGWLAYSLDDGDGVLSCLAFPWLGVYNL